MINVCNTFRPMDCTTGNFLLFSQYTEDLSRSIVDSNYQIRPSRFVCMSFGDTLKTNSKIILDDYLDQASYNDNQRGPGFFQNVFENGISCMKNAKENVLWHNFSTAFWGRMAQLASGTEESQNENSNLLTNIIKYFGDIDLESWEDGFADVVLNIKSGTKGINIIYNQNIENNWDVLDNFITSCGVYNYTQNDYISGWDSDSDLPIPGNLNQGEHNTPCGNINIGQAAVIDDGESSIFERIFDTEIGTDHSTESDSGSFTFDTIVLMYDIVDPSNPDHPLAKDIPMGVYFTGDIVDNKISNPVTIYDFSTDAYGAGSGWSLRIATRFSTTPFGTLEVEEVALESGAIVDSLSAQLSAVAELIKVVQDRFSENLKVSQDLKDSINQFKNIQKTNIPYVKDDGYWYVNGQNTGSPARYPATAATSEDIEYILNETE